jgi:hypothetical protein
MRDMMAQIRDVGDGIRGGTYTMTAPVITGGSITGVALSGNTLTNPVITGGSINNTTVGATTRSSGAFTTLTSNGATTFTAGTASTSTTTGTAVITGGLGVSGRINAANFDGIVGANTAAAGNFTTLGATGVATFSAGTVSAPAITTTGDTNTGIFFPAADTIAFTEGGVESMRIDASGNLGIGTSSPAMKLDVTGGGIKIGYQTAPTWTTDSFLWSESGVGLNIDGFNLKFNTGVSRNERMRIDSSGNVGIGTSSPAMKLDVNGIAGWQGGTTGQTAQVVGANSTVNAGGNFRILSNTTQAVDVGGSLTLGGYYNGTAQSVDFAQIIGAKANSTAGDAGGYLSFATRPSGGNTTERMRILSSGNVIIGSSTDTSLPSTGVWIARDYDAGSASGIAIGHANGSVSGNTYMGFVYNSTKIGSITQSGTTAVLYNLTSDQRLKTNIVDAPSGNIDDVKVRSFDWKSDGSHVEYGFIAQELVEVAPYAVHQPQDPEEMMAVDYSKLVPMMIKEIQDLKQRIKTLESK